MYIHNIDMSSCQNPLHLSSYCTIIGRFPIFCATGGVPIALQGFMHISDKSASAILHFNRFGRNSYIINV